MAISQKVSFQMIPSQDFIDVSFSLTCNSSGGPVSSVIWTRDGFLLDNTAPLVLINASTVSYTNVLVVNSRAPGTYTCQTRGPSDHVLSSVDFNVQGVTCMETECNLRLIIMIMSACNAMHFPSSCCSPSQCASHSG